MLDKYFERQVYDNPGIYSFILYKYNIPNSDNYIGILTGECEYLDKIYSNPIQSKIKDCTSVSLFLGNLKYININDQYGVIKDCDFNHKSLSGFSQYRDKNNNSFHYYELVPISLVKNLLEELLNNNSNKERNNRCCICNAIEEYIEPKDGKVYCYKHCSW